MPCFSKIAGVLLFILAGCATTAPVSHVRAVASASEAFNAASQPLLDEVAVAERERAWMLIKNPSADAKQVLDVTGLPGGGNRKLLLDLPVDQVLALLTISDPPATAAFRKAVSAIRCYATVLVLLAEGQNIEAARAELAMLATNLVGVLGAAPTLPPVPI